MIDAKTALQRIVTELAAGRVSAVVHSPPILNVGDRRERPLGYRWDGMCFAGLSLGVGTEIQVSSGYVATIGLSRAELVRIREQINELLGEESS